jgi:hypothetical protein
MMDRLMAESGFQYVEVTAHMGARPDHAVWQEQVYHLGGPGGGYPGFEDSTCYGTGPGLGGWNCRHNYHAFLPGVSERMYTDEQLRNMDPPPVTINGKTYTHYEATQKQRTIETAIRKSKRELVGLQVEGDRDAFQNAAIRLQMEKRAYREFSKAAHLPLQMERTGFIDFNRSVAGKAVWADRKAVDMYSAVRYNAKGVIVVTDTRKSAPPLTFKPNAVVDVKNSKGVTNRTIYDADGRQKVRIHPSDHGAPKYHPVGGHKHIVEYDKGGNALNSKPLPLSEADRRAHKDIL